MAKLHVHGSIVGTVYFITRARRYMTDRTILVNNGHGWKLGGKVKEGMTPREAYERQVAKQEEARAQFPAAFAYRKLLHDTCGMATRWQLHYAITLMPDDPDGVWADVCGDGYGRVHADIDEVVRLCGLYRLAVKETRPSRRDCSHCPCGAIARAMAAIKPIARGNDNIYRQVFKTSTGAAKRAAFMNAHNANRRDWYFLAVRFRDGVRDESAFDAAAWGRYTWRVERRPTVRALAAMARATRENCAIACDDSGR